MSAYFIQHSSATHSDLLVCGGRRSAFDFHGTPAALIPSFPALQYLLLATDGSLFNYREKDT